LNFALQANIDQGCLAAMARLWRWLAVVALVGGADPYLPDLDGAGVLLLCPQSVFKLHPFFDDVVRRILLKAPAATVLFTETDADGAFARAVARASPCAGTLVVAPLRRRLRFSDAFDYAEEFLSGEVVILANADIFFDDDSLLRLGDPRTLDLDRRVLALLRWEWTCAFDGDAVETLEDLNGLFYADGRPGADDCGLLRPRADSQDAWVFRAPLDGVDLPVELGRGKCDNHAAATLADAGYAVANPSLAVRPYHVQNCAKRANATAAPPKLRSYTSTTEVKGRMAYVPLSDAWLF
jgi:hypothetical protein